MKKQELENLLKHHDDLYYNQDNPEITDTEYDVLKKQYVELYGEYTYVPGEAKFNKFKHITPILSLDKVQIGDDEKLRKEITRLWPVVIQPKMDGLTTVFYPRTATFATRGNGYVGENITENMSKVLGIGHTVGIDRPIRSEVVMLLSQFKKINERRVLQGLEPFKNPRNAAAGMLRNKDASKVEGLINFAYNILTTGIETNDTQNQIETLSQTYYWNTVPSYVPTSIDEAINYIKSYDRSVLDYEIDGLVVKHNGSKKFGMTGHHPNNSIAVKFEAQGQWTTINKIVWQVGRTGKITPVAEFEPVDILGAEVSRATLHNYGIIKALKLDAILYEGKYTPVTEVFVVKANDVIPAIVEVKNPDISAENIYVDIVNEPKCCPECRGEVEKINDQLFCTNPECSAKILGRLVHLSQRDAFNIEGLSEETAKKLIDKWNSICSIVEGQMMNAEEVGEDVDWNDFNLATSHPSFIFNLKYEDILSLDGFADKSATNLYNQIQNSLKLPFDKFLYGAGIPLIGRRAAKDIAEFYYKEGQLEVERFAEDYFNDFELLKTMKGIGPETINSLKNNYETMLMPFGEYPFKISDVIPNKKADNQLTFVITGEFDVKRNDIKKLIEETGHKVSGSVSKKTNFLLAAPGEEGTTKYKKAKELDINIIHSIKELEEILND